MIKNTWQTKANKMISDMAFSAWKAAGNYPGIKRHRQYTLPALADTLVECLRNNDEEKAKDIFIRFAFSPEMVND